MPEESLYDLLQIESTADSQATRVTHRRVMLLHHPDRTPGSDAQKMTQPLNHAYEVLRGADRMEPTIMNSLVGLRNWPQSQVRRGLDQHFARGRSRGFQGRSG